ncbi:hypothetical protein NC653_012540 [Populus alba x Populus x berolinensis]|uniref:Uncharacterized protein n=1 Tax=Populus alba x Populus x berolinensis TaxID=444605 RepID=A0AAD6QSL8_9ROSI|nr:hypothetical protein NC653_012540 [Populus alba x Populus x berolinensis]
MYAEGKPKSINKRDDGPKIKGKRVEGGLMSTNKRGNGPRLKGLTKLLVDNAPKAKKEQKFKSYFSRKIAIDAECSRKKWN